MERRANYVVAAIWGGVGATIAIVVLGLIIDEIGVSAWLNKWQTMVAGVLGILGGASALLAVKIQITEQRRDKAREEIAVSEHKFRLLTSYTHFLGAQMITAVHMIRSGKGPIGPRIEDANRLARSVVTSAATIVRIVENNVSSGANIIRASQIVQIAAGEFNSVIAGIDRNTRVAVSDRAMREINVITAQTGTAVLGLAEAIGELVAILRRRPEISASFAAEVAPGDVEPTALAERIRKAFADYNLVFDYKIDP